jgi:hypothetical protein
MSLKSIGSGVRLTYQDFFIQTGFLLQVHKCSQLGDERADLPTSLNDLTGELPVLVVAVALALRSAATRRSTVHATAPLVRHGRRTAGLRFPLNPANDCPRTSGHR